MEEFKQSLKFPYHDNLGLSIYSCGIHSCPGGHSWGVGMRDHYLFHIFPQGEGPISNVKTTPKLSLLTLLRAYELKLITDLPLPLV